MNKIEIISSAAEKAITVNEITCGIFDPYPAYSFEPSDPQKMAYSETRYFVSCDRSRSELLGGIRLMAERMGVSLGAGFTA